MIWLKPGGGRPGDSLDMDQADTHIRIHPVAASACGGCVGSAQGPTCRSAFGAPCVAPQLSGDATLLHQAVDALRGVTNPEDGRNLIELQLLHALRIEDGEAELTVTFPRGCGAARLMAEDAFRVLRRALPDTDIYVGHAA